MDFSNYEINFINAIYIKQRKNANNCLQILNKRICEYVCRTNKKIFYNKLAYPCKVLG